MKVIYEGNGYIIEKDDDGRFFFTDNNDSYELSREIKNPDYICYDENKGWCYKNGKQLPWV